VGKSSLVFGLMTMITKKFGVVTENNVSLPTCHVRNITSKLRNANMVMVFMIYLTSKSFK